MNLTHLKRALHWISLLNITLIKFWVKNLRETPAILNFIFEKITASPRFFSRNVLTEKYAKELKNSLEITVQIYQRLNINFSFSNQKSYNKLADILDKYQLLYFLIRKAKPLVVVETGVAAGKSTSYILQALKDNHNGGKLYSIDLPFQWYIYGNHKLHLDSLPPGKMPGYLIPQQLKTNWKLILGNTYDQLPDLMKKLGKIDVFFHDSEHSDRVMTFEYNQSWVHLNPNGLLISDDISYTKAFNQFSKVNNVKKIIFKDLGIILKNG